MRSIGNDLIILRRLLTSVIASFYSEMLPALGGAFGLGVVDDLQN
jgi:hypothetical protein